MNNLPRGAVITAKELFDIGISRELQRRYVDSGWLNRVGTGAYRLLDNEINLDGAIRGLQNGLQLSIHVGGYTALAEKHGKAHTILRNQKSELFGYRGEKVPQWFIFLFGADSIIKLTSFLPEELGLISIDSGDFTIKISSVERAMLELLYISPSIHTLKDAYQVMEFITVAKPNLVQTLLEACTSIKVKRLFLLMAEQAGHTWLKSLDLSKINLGSGVREVEKGGSLNNKYNLVIGDLS